MSAFVAILLGIIQGFAGFLPISGSGHLSIFQNLFGLSAADDSHLLFDVMLHLGTFLSICVSFRRDLKRMFTACAAALRGETRRNEPPAPPVRMALLLLTAALPLVVVIPFYSLIKTLFFHTGFIGLMLLLTGALLFVSVKLLKPGSKNEKTLGVSDAVMIGLAQAVSVIPGLSRIGSTVTVALSRGASRDFSIRFSLLLSLPAVLGATVITLLNAIMSGIDWSAFPLYLLGFVFSAGTGIFAIGATRALMKNEKWIYFSYYCFGAGALTIILSMIFR